MSYRVVKEVNDEIVEVVSTGFEWMDDAIIRAAALNTSETFAAGIWYTWEEEEDEDNADIHN